ncbi:BRCA1-A complex subunit RAP80 isoform X2 [Dendrobates tinctorius]
MSMHHRRKPRFSEGTCSQSVVDDEESIFEAPGDIGPENSKKNEDTSIVISDSDDMELQESMKPKKRRKPPLNRKPLPVKRKIAQMTEEEQLALAVEMSQQEQTKQEEYTQEEEDELIKKAIQESLHSCQVPDFPISAANETSSSKEEPHLSQVSRHSDEGLTKSPVVLLQRLSQDIVDSPCVVLSPNCKDPVSCIESRLQVPLSPCTSSDFIKMSPGKDNALSPVFQNGPPSIGKEKSLSVLLQRLSQDIVENPSVVLSPNWKDPLSSLETCLQSPPSPCTGNDFVKLSSAREVTLSPVFPKKLPYSHRQIPCRLFQESATRVVDDLDDQHPHCSESPRIDLSPVLPTSSSQGESSCQNDFKHKESVSSSITKERACEDNESIDSTEYFDKLDKCNQNGGTVHYYWGVPFCPKGVDPSEYTKVILCQLEVYQKSLKNAQRQLLHKMDYGQPIHLVASSQENSQENSKEDPQSNISQEETQDSITEDDTQKLEEAEPEQDNNSDSQDTQPMSSKRQKTYQSPMQTVMENDHCSSSPNAKHNSKALFTKMLPSECSGLAPVAPGESAVSPTAVRNDRHLTEHPEIAQEEDITICPETQPSPAMQDESDKDDQTNGMEITPDPKACMSSEPSDITCSDKMISKDVVCPICDFTYPPTEIERHAAYCDGVNFQRELTVLRSRNNLLRSRDRSSISLTPKRYGKSEKCYICNSIVLLKDYQGHVDNCLQTESRETQESQSLRSIKEYPKRNGRLLNMLEQSESSLAGECLRLRKNGAAGGIKRCTQKSNCNEPESSNLSPPRHEHVDRSSSEHEDLSDSPIRSFVSISEATDCLVDFKKQFSHRPSGRRASHRGRGKKRRI